MKCGRNRESRHGASGFSILSIIPIISILLILLISPLAAAAAAFTADLSWGDVSLTVAAEPVEVDPGRDLLLTLTLTAPSYLTVTLPDLRERFSGFSVAEDFARDPVTAAEGVRREFLWRLVPEIEREYRLAPFAVTVSDTRRVPPLVTSFATRAVTFPPMPPPPRPDGDLEIVSKPVYVPPSARTITGWVLLGLAAAALLAAALWGLTRLNRHVRERRLSPNERALAELERLLRRRLVEKGLYKDFYIELTQVVRRYIERTHGIRAPSQTTEEFLKDAVSNPAFDATTLPPLRAFLESADLVKFADQTATPVMADQAVTAARSFVQPLPSCDSPTL